LLASFREAQVHAILHAGDICIPGVLKTLEQIAPVYAVQGNRDFFRMRNLPLRRNLQFAGTTIGLVHSHGQIKENLIEGLRMIRYGLQLDFYYQRTLSSFPSSNVVVFGHIHYPVNEWINGQLLFNPGSACSYDHSKSRPSAGLLHLHPEGIIYGEIIYLG